ncbi:MAG: hypothetical protein BWX88_02014 [Planctomycetes bacterium ADurb.Bin126]|nr:MAG: hypothetical protein BWX88_02014 [Planctomycetes bacterium ADurb.Bin126]
MSTRAGVYQEQATGYRAFSAVKDITGTSYAAANQLVDRLQVIGVLNEMTGQARHRRFRYEAYIRLFDEPREDGR